jgi:hypothetical protein
MSMPSAENMVAHGDYEPAYNPARQRTVEWTCSL